MTFSSAQIGLSSLLAVLLGAIAYEQLAPLPVFVPTATSYRVSPAPEPAAPFFIPLPSSFYASINERPVFMQARKPIAPAPVGHAAAPPPLPAAALVGVILDGTDRMALLKTPASPLEVSVPLGGNVGGWQVTQILPDRILLQLGMATDEIRLDSNRAKNEPGSKPATPSSQTRPPANAGVAPPNAPKVQGDQIVQANPSADVASAAMGPSAPAAVAGPANGTDKKN